MIIIRSGKEIVRNVFDVKSVRLVEASGVVTGIFERYRRRLWIRGWQGVQKANKDLSFNKLFENFHNYNIFP